MTKFLAQFGAKLQCLHDQKLIQVNAAFTLLVILIVCCLLTADHNATIQVELFQY